MNFNERKILKFSIIAVVCLLIVVVVGKKLGWIGAEKPISVSVEKVSIRTIYETVTANGRIEPVVDVKVSADVSGEIVELLVEEGQKVSMGQLLLKIKPSTYESVRDRAQAALDNARVTLENAKARYEQALAQYDRVKLLYDRNKTLWENKTISQTEWESAQTDMKVAEVDLAVARENVRSAEFGVKSAEASLAEAIENLRKTSVYAPIEGIVTRLNVRRGERVVGTEMMAGTELMHIADLSKMQVVVTVNENDIIRVKKGDTATVEIDAYYGNILKGVVTEIAHSATTTGQLTDQVTTFEVKIELLPSSYSHLVSNVNPYPLRPGMTANVDIHTQVKFNVVSVPLSALTARVLKNDTTIRSSTGSTNVVFVVKNNRAWMRRVITGIQDENYIEIVSGVSPGESVVVGPFIAVSKLLSDSSRVVIENKVKNLNE